MSSWNVTETKEGVSFKLKIQPRAGKNEITGIHGDELKVRLKAPPVDGAANEACIKFFAKLLGVTKKQVKIIAGQTNPHKTLHVEGLNKGDVIKRLSV